METDYNTQTLTERLNEIAAEEKLYEVVYKSPSVKYSYIQIPESKSLSEIMEEHIKKLFTQASD